MRYGPPFRYASRPGGGRVAYQVIDDGDLDLVFLFGWPTHLGLMWEDPSLAAFLSKLSSFSRLVLYDRLGNGLSDRLLVGHQEVVRRQLTRFRGREVKTTGDGFLATFDGPAQAIRAADAVRADLGELDLAVRVGLHTGECELLGDDIGGIAVPDSWQLYAVELAGG